MEKRRKSRRRGVKFAFYIIKAIKVLKAKASLFPISNLQQTSALLRKRRRRQVKVKLKLIY